jgi:hypothetical protein
MPKRKKSSIKYDEKKLETALRKYHSRYVNAKLPVELACIIDEVIVGRYGYRSRAEFVKDAVRTKLRSMGLYLKLSPEK